MPLRDILRGFMGLPGSSSDENNNSDVWGSDPFYDLYRDFADMMDESRPQPPAEGADDDPAHHGGGQDDFDFPIFPEPDDMFRHFEEQFRRTFQGFGLMDFPPGFGRPPLEAPLRPPVEAPGGESGNLRDRMLKPGLGEGARDSDLDDRVSDGGLSALLRPSPAEPAPSPAGPAPSPAEPAHPEQPFSFSRSFTLRRSVGPDGRVEERRVETGPEGQRRETVTRRQGDGRQTTTVTTEGPDGGVSTVVTEEPGDGGLPDQGPWPETRVPPADGAPRNHFNETFWRNLFGW